MMNGPRNPPAKRDSAQEATMMIRRISPIALFLLAAALPAWGQNALDSSLQKGSGGTNSAAKKPRPGAYQDAIVTGNVGGLKSFHGNIDYRAPGEFSAKTAEDDTYSFRLHSMPGTGPGYQNYPTSLLPRPNQTSSYLLRPGSGLTAGEVTGQYDRFGGAATVL